MADQAEPKTDAKPATWPKPEDRRLVGRQNSRLDGPAKASGRAKYTYDIKPPGMLWGKMLRCPHAHARLTALDVAPAQGMPGVKAVMAIQKPGAAIQWSFDEVAAVAAASEALAEAALTAIKVEYEVRPRFVTDEH